MKNLFLGIALGAIFAWVGGRDFLDEKADEQLYCKNVEQEIWYDSPERFHRICGDAFGHPNPNVGRSGQKAESFIM